MSSFAASIFLKALGWALVNSLWQFAICWLLYRSITGSIKKLSAATRHSIALLLLFSGSILFLVNLAQHYYWAEAPAVVGVAALAATDMSLASFWQVAGDRMDTLMPWWSLLYILCVAFLFIKLSLFVQRATSLQKNGVTKMNAGWRTYISSIAAQLGIQSNVKALLSTHIDTPQVIGFLKPVILLPAACLVNLTTAQLEAVLLHELVHIKRNDYLVNLFVASLEVLFFFNPFVKQLAAVIRKEREYSCDDMVIQFQHQPHYYAEALLTLEKSRHMPVTYGIAAGGKDQHQLLTRIQRILGIQNKETGYYRPAACLLVLLLLCFMAAIKPGKLEIDKFASAGLSLAANNITNLQYSEEASEKIPSQSLPELTGEPAAPGQQNKLQPPPSAEKDKLYPVQPFIDLLNEETPPEPEHIQIASSIESVDFSLQQKNVVPDDMQQAFTAEPYVPAHSFSYQFFQDTSTPKTKGETLNERLAKEALLKAQKVLEQINWLKIEKQLKYNSLDIAKLKKELSAQIQSLNWQKISREVQSQLSQEQLNTLQQKAELDQSIQHYRQTEAYYEALQKKMAEQEQVLKATEERVQETQKATEQQHKKLQQEMKKRRIIYI